MVDWQPTIPWYNSSQVLKLWVDLQYEIAASTVFQKYVVQILAHIIMGASLIIDYEYSYEMELINNKGARTKISFLSTKWVQQGFEIQSYTKWESNSWISTER